MVKFQVHKSRCESNTTTAWLGTVVASVAEKGQQKSVAGIRRVRF